jgi:SecD/SecF fusion protein
MNRTYYWKVLLVVFILAWAFFEIYPPTGRSVIAVFKERARNQDATFSNIVARAEQLRQEFPERDFGNLKEAVGTNQISSYFPFISVEGEKDPSHFVLTRLQQLAAGRIKLGLDLQGGTSFLVRMDTNTLERAEQKDAALSQAVEVLRKRVDKLGVAEPLIQPTGNDRILIQLPGLSQADMESAKRQIERAAFLEFRMVHENSEANLLKGIIPPGYEILVEQRNRPDGSKQAFRYLVKKKPERGLTGKYIKTAGVARQPITNEPEIHFEFDSEGARIFGEITTEFKPRQTPEGEKFFLLAIVLDGELYSAPRIMGPIPGGRGVITGTFSIREAFELANVLENPLEAPVKIIEERTVDPSLGVDSIRSGVRAAIVGTIAVAIFMLVYYMLAGLIANVALIFNIIFLLGVLCALPATLTLPGIAGVVLTVGMAVDANVLIFERIREEQSAGKSLRGAVAAGYSKAFGTIFDSNLTTLISAVILWIMGTGPVQGFGITLFWGIVISMFTALFITRLIFDFLLAKNLIKRVRMCHIFGQPKFDFLRWAKLASAASVVLITVGVAYGIFGRGKELMGVEFAGGDSLRIEFKQRQDVDKIRDAITALNVGSPMIQYQKDLGSGEEYLLVTTSFESGEKVVKALQQTFPDAGLKLLSIDKVGPVVGQEILRTAIVAVLLSLFGILVYVAFRFELSFAVGGIVALIHDVLFTFGMFSLSGRELSAPMVAAILTIIGFSINDTIVIFDRIREDLKLGVRGSFKDLMNMAINQTLSRTIITSGTVFLSTVALYTLGGGIINDFSFTFLVGIVVGTYSSVYIASAIVLWWHKGERPRPAPEMAVDRPETARA